MNKSLSDILGIDVRQFLQDSVDFVNTYNQILIDYLSDGKQYPRDAYVTLDNLISRYDQIARRIAINRHQIEGLWNFQVVDQIENMRSIFRVFDNYSRWMRSSIVKGRFVDSAELIYVTKQNQTIESFSRSAGYQDGETGFLDLTLRNKISERSYDLNGGLTFKFSYQNDNAMVLESVVDNMTGDNLLGKDIAQKLQFVDDDLLTLSPEDTFLQTCGILISLTKNSNPEFPTEGFNKETLTNRNVLNNMLPTFIRQMYSIVANDDTVAAFSITNTSLEGDALRVDMEFQSHLSYEVKQSVYGNSDI